ncbi:MAG: ABC transporter ATP-binding protein [Anaerolineae bacterium]|nr:ABC transporter ATP-binding protein [Anaerolineae bacterium]
MATSLTSLKREFSVSEAYVYNQSSPLRWVFSHLWRYKGFLLFYLVMVVIMNALFSSIPRLTGQAFDIVLAQTDTGRLFTIALTILTIVVVRGAIDLSSALSVETLGQRLERDARDELYVSLLGKSQTFHNRQRVGDVMARATNDIRQLNPMINPGFSLMTDASLSLLMPMIFIASIKLELLLSPLIFVVLLAITLRHYNRQLRPVVGRVRGQFGEMNAGLAEAISGIEVVKSTAQEAQEQRKFRTNARGYRDAFVQQGQVEARYLPPLILGIALAGAFSHGLWLVIHNQITIGDLVAYMGLMGILRFPAFISIFTFSLIQLGLAGAGRILELMQEETELDENKTGYQAQMQGHLQFENVTFYLGDKPVLTNVSFEARPGQTVAIVGQTGSGKSTLTKLVNRIYDVRDGRILIDGVDVRDWNLASLRSQISTIEQDIFLFSRTIAENIAFGLGQQVDQAAIEQAARAAQAHDFITGFKDGYQTIIGERGVTLSGGQRQRLAIARALLTAPRLLMIDDSTSAIDSATEDKIQRAINRVLEGRTTLLITHRLSQIRRAGKILVLKQGQIVDQGTHDELMARCDLYQRIFARYE